MFTVKAAKANFFDKAKVQKAMDRTTVRNLSKFGSFVRQRSRTSIRYAPKVYVATGLRVRGRPRKGMQVVDATSLPGAVPYGHRTSTFKKTNRKTNVTKVQAKSPLKELIFFVYDAKKRSVITGPAYFDRRRPGAPGKGMELLEYGGTATMRTSSRYSRAARFRKRPFMKPAFDAEIKSLPHIWRDSLREN